MRRLRFALLLLLPAAAAADPPTDLRQVREYFKAKYPTLRLDDYSNGVTALPGNNRRAGSELAAPALERALAQGRKEWRTPFKNGKTYASCFVNDGKNVAQHYPYWHDISRMVRTAEMDLIDCLKKNGEARLFTTADPATNAEARTALANLTAAFYELSANQLVDIDLSEAEAIAAYEEGKRYWWARRGRLNLACADCHMGKAGKPEAGAVRASAALGHPVAWPAYRMSVGGLESIHQRYTQCNLRIGAKPEPLGSRVYNHLQIYQTYLSSGVPLSAPAVRD